MADNKSQQTQPSQEVIAELEALKSQLADMQAQYQQAENRASQAENDLQAAHAKIEAAAAKQERAAVDQLKKQEKVWLTINSNGNDSSAVPVSVNGYAFRILRDKRALVPRAVAEVLKLAVYDKPVVERLPNGQTRTTFKSINRFSFTVEPAEKDAKAEDA